MEKEEKIGEPGYINENCWLVRTLNYTPYKRCQYCELEFHNCLFLHYQIISLLLIISIFTLYFLIERNNSEFLIISVFTLVIVYGYFFNKSTDKIIQANFTQRKAEISALREKISREETERLAGERSKLAEQFQIVAIQSTAFKQTAEEIVQREMKLRKKAEKIAQDFQQLTNIRNQMFLTGQHHTRTPLSNIQNFAYHLLEGGFGPINKEQKQALQTIVSKVQESIELANLYLNVSEFEAGKGFLDKKEVSLEKIIKAQTKKLALETELKRVKIITQFAKDLPEILLDPEKMGMVYWTLLDNAIKYTPQKEGKIILGLKKTEKETILFSCQDNGIGIKKEEIPNIARLVFQRSKEARSVHGTGKGLALYLSNLIVESHGGKLWAESEGLGKGSTFYVELPVRKIKN